MTPDEIKALVRTIPDFPKTGIQFRDITTLLGHGRGFAATVEWLTQAVAGAEAIAGMEARGFIFGAAVAARLELPFLPIRKPGKLPCEVIDVEYELEYGLDRLELDPAAVGAGQHVAIVDDLLATGGTAVAATELLRKAGARVDRAAFVIDLPDLGGNARLASQSLDVRALMAFDGD
ncbi:MAG: adenine phosphoribosyltransferase [Erythrobacter sp.]|nr:MAG: adenine phosphoribosyltransferase [Erythrobacter sp.]